MSALSDVAQIDGSPPALIVASLIEQHGFDGAKQKIREMLDAQSNVELAGHAYDWSFWARPKQIIPPDGWESWGFLAGRGNGKSLAISKFVNGEVEAGRSQSIVLIAQDEDSSVKLHVTGPSGLIATAKPWFKPEWCASALELVWPNGAKAYVRTPEVPRKIRGLEYDLGWCSELQSWPDATMDESWMNVQISTRLRLPRIVWDATAKRRHPLLTRLLKESEADPIRHRVIRGSTYENCLNLGRGYIEKIERRYGGTRQGEEELFARMFDDAEGATAKAEWINKARRPLPEKFLRRAIGVDPAVTSRAGSDLTGLVLAGLGVDGQGYILGDFSGKHSPEAWATIVIDTYFQQHCDCVVVETNKGGDYIARNLRAAAKEREFSVVMLGKDEKPKHIPRVIYVKEVHARGSKADRAQPLSTAYERGRISHVYGAKLDDLEDLLTTWIPSPGKQSPDRLDATVHVMVELLGLADDEPDRRAGFRGLDSLAAAGGIASQAPASKGPPAPKTRSLATVLGGIYGPNSRI